jgi:SAM-dependent methyltransferase
LNNPSQPLTTNDNDNDKTTKRQNDKTTKQQNDKTTKRQNDNRTRRNTFTSSFAVQHSIQPSNKHNTHSMDHSNDQTDDNTDAAKTTVLPQHNDLYADLDYWDDRFAREDDYEWLATFGALESALEPYWYISDYSNSHNKSDRNKDDVRILVVGCGNAPFSADLYDAGYTQVVNLDYSATVIQRMRARHAELRPRMTWICGDMTCLTNSFDEDSFDVVLDKAAMDALTADEGDVWHPAPDVVARSRLYCAGTARILAPGGRFLQISLTQPHFRRPYLLGWHGRSDGNASSDRNDDDKAGGGIARDDRDPTFSKEFGWTLDCQTLHDVGNSGSFGHFLYIATKTTTTTISSATSS